MCRCSDRSTRPTGRLQLLLTGARLLGPLTGQAAGIEGYRFASGARTITAFWSNSEQIAGHSSPARRRGYMC